MDQKPQNNEPVPEAKEAPATTPQQPATAPVENPGQLFGILAIVADFIGLAVAGIVLGVLSRNKSKAAGQPTTLGSVGLWLGVAFTVLGLLWFLLVGGAILASILAGSSTPASY